LREQGVESVEQLAQMTPDDLMQIRASGEKTVERIRRVVTDYFERDQSGEGAPGEGAEAPLVGRRARSRRRRKRPKPQP
jgi:hypothetical protein